MAAPLRVQRRVHLLLLPLLLAVAGCESAARRPARAIQAPVPDCEEDHPRALRALLLLLLLPAMWWTAAVHHVVQALAILHLMLVPPLAPLRPAWLQPVLEQA